MELGRTFERAHTYDNGCAVPLEIPRWADPKNLISPRSVAVQNSSSITLCRVKNSLTTAGLFFGRGAQT